jgi:hypothetical protein
MDRVIAALQSVVSQKRFANGGLNSVEYIDLRYGNKIFYKFGTDVTTMTATTTTPTTTKMAQ